MLKLSGENISLFVKLTWLVDFWKPPREQMDAFKEFTLSKSEDCSSDQESDQADVFHIYEVVHCEFLLHRSSKCQGILVTIVPLWPSTCWTLNGFCSHKNKIPSLLMFWHTGRNPTLATEVQVETGKMGFQQEQHWNQSRGAWEDDSKGDVGPI